MLRSSPECLCRWQVSPGSCRRDRPLVTIALAVDVKMRAWDFCTVGISMGWAVKIQPNENNHCPRPVLVGGFCEPDLRAGHIDHETFPLVEGGQSNRYPVTGNGKKPHLIINGALFHRHQSVGLVLRKIDVGHLEESFPLVERRSALCCTDPNDFSRDGSAVTGHDDSPRRAANGKGNMFASCHTPIRPHHFVAGLSRRCPAGASQLTRTVLQLYRARGADRPSSFAQIGVRNRSLLSGLLGDHQVLDLVVCRLGNDFLGEQLAFIGVRTPIRDFLRVHIANAR